MNDIPLWNIQNIVTCEKYYYRESRYSEKSDHSEFWELPIRTLLVLLDLGHFELIHVRKFYTTNKYLMCILYIINIYVEKKHVEYLSWVIQSTTYICLRWVI